MGAHLVAVVEGAAWAPAPLQPVLGVGWEKHVILQRHPTYEGHTWLGRVVFGWPNRLPFQWLQ
jgi:hypothetical protein